MINGVILLICQDQLFLQVYKRILGILDTPRYTTSGGDRVNIHIGCSYTHFLFYFILFY